MELVDESIETEAEYALERPVNCPSCSATLRHLHVVRSLRTRVNFTSNLPRRGYVIICPGCDVILAASLGSRVL